MKQEFNFADAVEQNKVLYDKDYLTQQHGLYSAYFLTKILNPILIGNKSKLSCFDINNLKVYSQALFDMAYKHWYTHVPHRSVDFNMLYKQQIDARSLSVWFNLFKALPEFNVNYEVCHKTSFNLLWYVVPYFCVQKPFIDASEYFTKLTYEKEFKIINTLVSNIAYTNSRYNADIQIISTLLQLCELFENSNIAIKVIFQHLQYILMIFVNVRILDDPTMDASFRSDIHQDLIYKYMNFFQQHTT